MPGSFDIREEENLDRPEVAALLREHLEFVAIHSPPESIHALNLDGLRSQDVTFYTAWEFGSQDDGDTTMLVGCGALKELDPTHGEIKSMRTANGHLRRGVGAAMLDHLLTVARERCYQRVSLETGRVDAFAPARALYASRGFKPTGPFADYTDDPFSVFLTLDLT